MLAAGGEDVFTARTRPRRTFSRRHLRACLAIAILCLQRRAINTLNYAEFRLNTHAAPLMIFREPGLSFKMRRAILTRPRHIIECATILRFCFFPPFVESLYLYMLLYLLVSRHL